MVSCNLMTGTGFDLGLFGGFGMAWFGIVILFFLIALIRRWVGEGMDVPFNMLWSVVIGVLAYIIVVSLSCSTKWSLLAGIIGMLIGGFGLPAFGIGGGE